MGFNRGLALACGDYSGATAPDSHWLPDMQRLLYKPAESVVSTTPGPNPANLPRRPTVSRIAHITLLCRGAAQGARAGLFGSDRPLEKAQEHGLPPELGRIRFDAIIASPERSARQAAERPGQDVAVDAGLADIDFGRWTGRSLADIAASEADGLQAWMSDPHACPHGGESIARFHARIARWLDALGPHAGNTLVITHPSVIRCLVMHVLDAPLPAFWKIDVDYGGVTDITGNGLRLALRSLNRRPAGAGGEA